MNPAMIARYERLGFFAESDRAGESSRRKLAAARYWACISNLRGSREWDRINRMIDERKHRRSRRYLAIDRRFGELIRADLDRVTAALGLVRPAGTGKAYWKYREALDVACAADASFAAHISRRNAFSLRAGERSRARNLVRLQAGVVMSDTPAIVRAKVAAWLDSAKGRSVDSHGCRLAADK